jgi:peptidoglycan/xylan/chitin deacetylase (PgdA/CDA1 family)
MPSIDRIATLYFFHPMARTLAQRGGIPILMYHSISDDAPEDRDSYFATTTAPQVFHDQMQFLHSEGYRTITLSEASRQLESNTRPEIEKQVVITFDDGFEDFYLNAVPAMQRFGFTATMYLATDYVGKWTQRFKGRNCLTWSQVSELEAAGMSFGSHTVSHPQLYSIQMRQVENELRDSKKVIEDNLGHAIDSFCYPYAFPEQDKDFTSNVRQLLTHCGYSQGVCTIVGIAAPHSDRLFLPRLPVSSRDDSQFLRAKLEGGYDWLHKLQFTAKSLKARFA